MISYRPFWETLKKTGVSTYVLINQYSISSNKGIEEQIALVYVDDLVAFARFFHVRIADLFDE